ncbi:uncharacterized protein LOC127798255 isoform X2 [Diospyros lotus]|uniref:uncharacterized protein LOC127798255 isoform X2 n=1 Tax=Diospyros lotus TaxID=55363 RepID=UPI00224F57A2|nr:uncharacterized protein LOC127798255 isoform X2 [Diospyros lotus]
MVLGLRSKNRKGTSIQVDYFVNVQEIRPWPPSQSLRSVQSVLLHWENGDQNYGSFSTVVGNGSIEFNKSFALPVTLSADKRSRDSFQKNCLEFHLYESRNERAAKGQSLGSSIINLADYGVIKETLPIRALVNCKKSSKNAAQPVLHVTVQPLDKYSSNSSPNSSLSKEASLDKDGGEFFSELMNERNGHECEIASFTDDDVSPHSSQTFLTSPLEGISSQNVVADGEMKSPQENVEESVRDNVVNEHTAKSTSSEVFIEEGTNTDLSSSRDCQADGDGHRFINGDRKNSQLDATTVNEVSVSLPDGQEKKEQQKYGKDEPVLEEMSDSLGDRLGMQSSLNASRKPSSLRSETLTFSRSIRGVQGTNSNKLKHVKSVQLPFTSAEVSGLSDKSQNVGKAAEVDNLKHALGDATYNAATKGNKPNNGFSDSKIDWKSRIEKLEEELSEAAIIEAALYSVVAEHASSTNKVHAPARRLSRFYLHSYQATSHSKRASAARSAVSGLILVTKSCGTDVPRLTFWLSNSIMLRAIVNQAVLVTPLSDRPNKETTSRGKVSSAISLLERGKFSPTEKEKSHPTEELCDWANPQAFAIALEKVEAWIFSRIVESVWWQTMTPHMQSTAAKTGGRGSSSRKSRHVLGDQEQGSFSTELWKKAFNDARERLCPIRAAGHECACLPVLARLVMEQLVHRLDVAMFNAILRESADEMPTDPMSDPVSDPKVLPILAGKSSFGAGAQLKNAIGNWSRWLTDLFGMEDNDSPEDENDHDNSGMSSRKSFKPFRLLNALSDLMMLPTEMLADSSTRKEICPMFDASLIKRVLSNFVPDEFSPEPIPAAVLEALDAEDTTGELVTVPCTAMRTIYSPPLAASLAGFIGDVGIQNLQRSASSVLRKSYTSDDELDELNSPITCIINENSQISPSSTSGGWIMPKGGRDIVRYKLLREVWRDGE